MDKKKILITGGTGFQGSNLAKRLLDKDYEVVILDTFSEVSFENVKKFELEKSQIVWGSITDKNLIEKTVRDVDLVFHAAANVNVDDSISEPIKYYEVNVLGTNNILEEIRKKNISMIHVSTCEVYGYQEDVLKENSPFRSNSPYASSKAGADVMCYAYWKTYGCDITIVRPANVFGPGQRYSNRGAVIPIWVNAALKDKEIKVFGDGKQSREFIYIDDLIDVYELLIEYKLYSSVKNRFSGEMFNVGTNRQITMNKLAKCICDNIGKGEIVHYDPRLGEVKKFELDSSKVMRWLDWEPSVTIEEGIKKYINWIKNV